MRRQPGATGEIIYHLRNLLDNRALADAIRVQYSQPALVPATPWLDSIPPDKPKLTVTIENSNARAHWGNGGSEPAWLWVLQFRINNDWTTEILPSHETMRTFFNSQPDVVAVSSVDREENESEPAVLQKTILPSVHQRETKSSLNWQLKRNR